jgi:hypothetical protein
LWQTTQFISKIGLTSVAKSTPLAGAFPPARAVPAVRAVAAHRDKNLIFAARMVKSARPNVKHFGFPNPSPGAFHFFG